MHTGQIEGKGADANPINRPGIPMETEPAPMEGGQLLIDQQESDYTVLMHGGKQQLPPVFGTAAPLRGMSGLIRKLAYKYPDHWARHWMMLIMADRVDSWEHNLGRLLPVAAVGLVGGVAYKLLRR